MTREEQEHYASLANAAENRRLEAEVERLKIIEVAAKAVINEMDCASSSAQARRLSIIALRAALRPHLAAKP